MKITLKKPHKDIPEGAESERLEKRGQVMYRFEADSDHYTYAEFSWNYIQNHKEYFKIQKGE